MGIGRAWVALALGAASTASHRPPIPPHLCAAMQLATVKLRYATNLAGNPKLRGESEK